MGPELSGSRTGLSIVIPILNEQDNLPELYRRLTNVLTDLNCAYQIIFVDDGSSDDSGLLCRELADSDSHVLFVELRRHFGKSTALQAGFRIAQGDVIITLDGDLQDDPDEIPRFLGALEGGLDLVSGWKRDRQDPITKRLPSRLYNFVTSALTGIPLHDFNCGFKAYRREVIGRLDLYGELHRYIPVLAHTKGFRVGEIPVRHHPRRHGKTKYGADRLLRGTFDLITVLFLSTFQRRPMHLFGLLGLVFALSGFAIDLYLAFLWFIGERPIGDRPLLTLGTLLIILGVQVLVFGLLAEMIAAATHRQSDVTELIRKVHHHPAVNLPERGASLVASQDVED